MSNNTSTAILARRRIGQKTACSSSELVRISSLTPSTHTHARTTFAVRVPIAGPNFTDCQARTCFTLVRRSLVRTAITRRQLAGSRAVDRSTHSTRGRAIQHLPVVFRLLREIALSSRIKRGKLHSTHICKTDKFFNNPLTLCRSLDPLWPDRVGQTLHFD